MLIGLSLGSLERIQGVSAIIFRLFFVVVVVSGSFKCCLICIERPFLLAPCVALMGIFCP